MAFFITSYKEYYRRIVKYFQGNLICRYILSEDMNSLIY